ncbi:hypothetical protein [Xanthomonas phage JGB6]|nr:hypothetical protein [Xanthomonas phage JGB6]
MKWRANGTKINLDDAHPNTNGYTLMATEAKTVLSAL